MLKKLENGTANAWQESARGISMINAASIVLARVTEKARRFVLSVLRNLHTLLGNIIAKLKKQLSMPTAAPSAPAVANPISNSCPLTMSAAEAVLIEKNFAAVTVIAGEGECVYIYGSNVIRTRRGSAYSAGTAIALTVNWATALTSGIV
jgi:hypothetical protein